jgi:hypothetical protein
MPVEVVNVPLLDPEGELIEVSSMASRPIFRLVICSPRAFSNEAIREINSWTAGSEDWGTDRTTGGRWGVGRATGAVSHRQR